ncbi:hypothetical protein HMPREF1984_01939 [Leptotrichia sp. oral taxon 215 str. W9775]|uniref:ATP-binding protein n=1 Tax=Leptotrichia sp. oral taxon 215 TaxID=712359 RepID=UPI0003AE328D|nr:DUF87 domain-containing protein [Leptotrichia sp. oral taxon 215]ERK65998.1 hypothetical protein HMPREF1984_01939 [Leptotrichia sp. oral taxon 215 str. W9775]
MYDDKLQTIAKNNYIPEQKSIQENFNNAIKIVDDVLLKNYLTKLEELEVVPFSSENEDLFDTIRFFKITEMIYEKDEYSTYKFASVYNSLISMKCAIFIIIDSDGEKTDFYMGVKSLNSSFTINSLRDTLKNALNGQFPGIKTENYTNDKMQNVLDKIKINNISAVSCVANDKIDEKNNVSFVQGLEKLALSMQNQKYTGIIIANGVEQGQLAEIRKNYENIYTQLIPFSKSQVNYSVNESINVANAFTTGKSESKSYTTNSSETYGKTTSQSTSKSESYTEKDAIGKISGVTSMAVSTAGLLLAPMTGGASLIGAGVLSMGINSLSAGFGKTHTKGTTTTESTSENHSYTSGTSMGDTYGTNQSNTETKGMQRGNSQNITMNIENKSISNILEKLDIQFERIKEFESLGLWECAAYFVSENSYTSEIAASTYKALMSGINTGVEVSAVNSWSDKEKVNEIRKYIKNFYHPLFLYNNISQISIPVTPTVTVSGNELALHIGFPRKSVTGFPVIEHVDFAKEVMISNNDKVFGSINLGNIYNMGTETKTKVRLNRESLAMHTFITGSTGSGKSNTIYEILDQLDIVGIKFMIIEPAKGEYKNVFGNRNNVTVLGTNPNYSELLKINPFKFPKSVHVLEHVDRLIEIFNVCWPMYAAMPAVLKDAVLCAYEDCGWDLVESVNKISDELFPTFTDLEKELWTVIKNSAYSDELKGNYIGSLVTRIKSLTNGLNGQIFASDEIDNKLLFDKNVIIDLSRIGSLETKSLIMGILVMRLNEYRMSEVTEMNSKLKHVTVLEEAHNILKRVSTEQNSESSNVSGKSVEMLSNAIAEMRTYGEGFIIADQSPNAVDVSAIRNTNTKIIMRLPDEIDRRLAGKAAALKDEQLDEIAKLPKGVAVVYQNDWIEPVLCKINRFEGKEEQYNYIREYTENPDEYKLKQEILKLLLKTRVNREILPDIEYIDRTLVNSKLSTIQKVEILEQLDEYRKTNKLKIWETNKFKKLSKIVTDLIIDKNNLKRLVDSKNNFEELHTGLINLIENNVKIEDVELKLAIAQSLMKEYSSEGEDALEIYSVWRKFVVTGGNVE